MSGGRWSIGSTAPTKDAIVTTRITVLLLVANPGTKPLCATIASWGPGGVTLTRYERLEQPKGVEMLL